MMFGLRIHLGAMRERGNGLAKRQVDALDERRLNERTESRFP